MKSKIPPTKAEFFVSGKPYPKARARVTRRGTFTPKSTLLWERDVRTFYQQQCRGIFFNRNLPLTFYAEIICPGRGSPSSIRGDVDNYFKSCADALNGLAFADDKQIIDARVIKRRRRLGEKCGARIRIEVFET